MDYSRKKYINKTHNLIKQKNKDTFIILNNVFSNFSNKLEKYKLTINTILHDNLIENKLTLEKLKKTFIEMINNVLNYLKLYNDNINVKNINNIEIYNIIDNILCRLVKLNIFIKNNDINYNLDIKNIQNDISTIDEELIKIKLDYKKEEEDIKVILDKENIIYNKELSRIKNKYELLKKNNENELSNLMKEYMILNSEKLDLLDEKKCLDIKFKSKNEINKIHRNTILENVNNYHKKLKNNKKLINSNNEKILNIKHQLLELDNYLKNYNIFKLNINKTYYNTIEKIAQYLKFIYNGFIVNDNLIILEQNNEFIINEINDKLHNKDYQDIFKILLNTDNNENLKISKLIDISNIIKNTFIIDQENYNYCVNKINRFITINDLNVFENILDNMNNSKTILFNEIMKEINIELNKIKNNYVKERLELLKKERKQNEIKYNKLNKRLHLLLKNNKKKETLNLKTNEDYLLHNRMELVIINNKRKEITNKINVLDIKISKLNEKIDKLKEKNNLDIIPEDLKIDKSRCENRYNKINSRNKNKLIENDNNFKAKNENLTNERNRLLNQIKNLKEIEYIFNTEINTEISKIINTINNNIKK
jgi:hypothetical protein